MTDHLRREHGIVERDQDRAVRRPNGTRCRVSVLKLPPAPSLRIVEGSGYGWVLRPARRHRPD